MRVLLLTIIVLISAYSCSLESDNEQHVSSINDEVEYYENLELEIFSNFENKNYDDALILLNKLKESPRYTAQYNNYKVQIFNETHNYDSLSFYLDIVLTQFPNMWDYQYYNVRNKLCFGDTLGICKIYRNCKKEALKIGDYESYVLVSLVSGDTKKQLNSNLDSLSVYEDSFWLYLDDYIDTVNVDNIIKCDW